MKKGEKGIFIFMAVFIGGLMIWNATKLSNTTSNDKKIPFYSTASPELNKVGSSLYRRYQCKKCHTLWGVRDMMQSVPAPALDGIGSIRDQDWLFNYISSDNPQEILPSRLKTKYQMPSFGDLPEEERQQLAAYLASLKVEDWYLDETKRSECRKLTGEEC